MKFVRTALLEGVCVVTPDTSGATSSTDLLRSCAEIVKARPTEGGDVNIPLTGLICWYYMAPTQTRQL
jgi:hypothetical protein